VSYADALGDLVRAASEADLAVALEKPQGEATRLCETIFGPTLATEIMQLGYPKAFDMPWIVEDFHFHGLDELSDRQAGYRFHGITGERIAAWPADRFVIAAWTGNPVSVGQGGSVCYSRHGAGTWTYIRIAPNLSVFLALLAAWIRYFVAKHGGDLFDEDDDDFHVSEEMRAEIRRDVLGVVAEADRMPCSPSCSGNRHGATRHSGGLEKRPRPELAPGLFRHDDPDHLSHKHVLALRRQRQAFAYGVRIDVLLHEVGDDADVGFQDLLSLGQRAGRLAVILAAEASLQVGHDRPDVGAGVLGPEVVDGLAQFRFRHLLWAIRGQDRQFDFSRLGPLVHLRRIATGFDQARAFGREVFQRQLRVLQELRDGCEDLFVSDFRHAALEFFGRDLCGFADQCGEHVSPQTVVQFARR
jgi:hypothetical protein